MNTRLVCALLLAVLCLTCFAKPSPGGEPRYLSSIKAVKGLSSHLRKLGYDIVSESDNVESDQIHVILSDSEKDTIKTAVKKFYDNLYDTESDKKKFKLEDLVKILLDRQAPASQLSLSGLATASQYFAKPFKVPAGYHNYTQVYQFLDETSKLYPDIAQVIDITKQYGKPTWEGRSILAIKISDNVQKNEDEPNVLIVSLHHAREVTTPELTMYAIQQLTSQYGKDPVITKIVNENQIYIVPVVNPDGMNYVFTKNNWWRKNRRDNGKGVYGVDLNRNYDIGWKKCVADEDPDSETYKGPTPFSEPESATIRDFSKAISFSKVLDFHSYGQEVLTGYLCTQLPPSIKQYIMDNGKFLGNVIGYNTRFPSDDGEHQEYQIKTKTMLAHLVEIGQGFQPSYADCQKEVKRAWPLIYTFLNITIPLIGHVVDAETQQPLIAKIDIDDLQWYDNETKFSEPTFGSYSMFLPQGDHTLTFSALGYLPKSITVTFPDIRKSNYVTIVKDIGLHKDTSSLITGSPDMYNN